VAERRGARLDDTAKVFVISVAAQLAGMHPQTLRSYDRLGLVSPARATGGGRRYSARDVALLREVQRLSQEEGVNLAGVKRIIELENQVQGLQQRVAELRGELDRAHAAVGAAEAAVHASYRRDLVPLNESAVVVWRPGQRR
jgi:MerR family transcriptional regulator/heat shock protein HspR